MKRVIRSVALSVAVVLAAFPAVTLACQWACAPFVAGHSHHDAAPSEGMVHASHQAVPSTDPHLMSAALLCAHAEAAIDTVSTLPVHASSCVAESAAAGVVIAAERPGASSTIGSPSPPPGARSAPFALRI